ncbi:MAG: hypothetical protein ACK4UT_02185, partial [Moraxellaceae bacterium]
LAALPSAAAAMPAVAGDSDVTQVHAATVLPTPRHRRLPWRAGAAALLLAGLLFWWWPRPDPQVSAWLAQAEARYARDQLGTPQGDSAIFYYRLVQGRDPDNAAARQGLAKVALRYGELARLARDKGDVALALEYVRRGLELAPEDADLAALQQALRAARREQRDGVQKFFDNLLGR